MAITLYHKGRRPSYPQFGLDQFTEQYRTDSPADVASLDASVPQKGAAHGTYPFMFVSDRHFTENANTGCDIEIIYMGAMAFTSQTSGTLTVGVTYLIQTYHSSDDFTNVGAASNATGVIFTATGTTPTTWTHSSVLQNPTLPPPKHTVGSSVRSATSSSSAALWPHLATQPCTVEYFAPTSEITVFNLLNSSGTTYPDPPVVTSLLTIQIVSGGTFPALGDIALATWILNNAFVQIIVETTRAPEIVAGQFWQITKTKTQTLFPWAPTSSGSNIVINNPGTGYKVADTLTISAGGQSAGLTVSYVNATDGSIVAWNVTSDTFTVAQTALSASGGTGSGATFDVIIV